MTIDFTTVKFDQDDFNTLHDIIYNALEIDDLTNEQLLEYWEKLPEDIKFDVLKWGISDTPTSEAIHEWLQENK